MSSGYYRLGANVSGKVLALGMPLPLHLLPLQAPSRDDAPSDMPSMAATLTSREIALSQGYTGNTCSNCGGAHMKVSGHCEVCTDCGTTTGCS